jgi:hypothetical protein
MHRSTLRDSPEEYRCVIGVVRVVVVIGGASGTGLMDGLGQSLLQPGIDLPQEAVSFDNVEPCNDAHVHGGDDHRDNGGHACCMSQIRSTSQWANLHDGTTR